MTLSRRNVEDVIVFNDPSGGAGRIVEQHGGSTESSRSRTTHNLELLASLGVMF
jgi:hypothetical protein